ncbi:MAG: DUF924 domain-containing protein [Rhodobacteraceae bacterium]|nr:DUF924 domain-containing protein [Paracoccaceae bacterium]
MTAAEQVLEFWFKELSPQDHFMGGDRVDGMIKDRFADLWQCAAGGGCSEWEGEAASILALILVLDQFPRNMFRGSGQSFHSDALAREVASRAIENGLDMQISEPDRLFFYMPFMHSERLGDQDRCVTLIAERMKETGKQNLLHAKAHRGIIELFGRFPYRNEALGRENSPEESDWMQNVGYMKFVQQLEEG